MSFRLEMLHPMTSRLHLLVYRLARSFRPTLTPCVASLLLAACGGGSSGGSDGSTGTGGEVAISSGAVALPDPRPAGYTRIVFSDDFEGSELDRGRWCTRMPFGGGPPLQVADADCTTLSGLGYLDFGDESEQQRFRDFNTSGEPLHVVSEGTIKLRATRTRDDPYLAYEAGALRSKRTFVPDGSRSYFFEIRARLPNVLGSWPVGVLFPGIAGETTPQWPPEIDFFEGALNGDYENATSLILHGQVYGAQTASGKPEWFFADPGFDLRWSTYFSPSSLRERWVDLAFEWAADGLCYFVDRVRVGCENYRWLTNDGSAANPAILALYLAIGGAWAGRNGIDDANIPTQLEIDHVRVYEGDGTLATAAGLDRTPVDTGPFRYPAARQARGVRRPPAPRADEWIDTAGGGCCRRPMP